MTALVSLLFTTMIPILTVKLRTNFSLIVLAIIEIGWKKINFQNFCMQSFVIPTG